MQTIQLHEFFPIALLPKAKRSVGNKESGSDMLRWFNLLCNVNAVTKLMAVYFSMMKDRFKTKNEFGPVNGNRRNSAILMNQLSIIFQIPVDIELCMTLGRTKVTNLISNTSLSNTYPQ